MYIRTLHVKDVKLLRDLRIDFTRDDKPRMWTVLVGENGLCKTTILQSIALAASGPDRANQLAEVVRWTPDFGRLDKVEFPCREAPYQEQDDGREAASIWGGI
jgi:recombinational DNA repair ATPase RecF